MSIRPIFQLKNPPLILGHSTLIMGILNVTPDSFSDGGKYLDPDQALDHALAMHEAGAHTIDIGGESSRPKGPYAEGATTISPEEECRRTTPIIKKLTSKLKIPISIDTTKASVAQQALENGAKIVNDISALRFDPQMAPTIAKWSATVVLMHMKGTPQTMQDNPVYEDVIGEISQFLSRQIEVAQTSGIRRQNIIIDPGLGFGKCYGHNIEILARLSEFHQLGCPLLVGPSRKQFTAPNDPPHKRLPGTLAAMTQCVLAGAHMVRVHDVSQTKQAVMLADQILKTQPFENP